MKCCWANSSDSRRSVSRSARVVAYLANQGYPAVNVDGGMQVWSAQGREVVADAGTPEII